LIEKKNTTNDRFFHLKWNVEQYICIVYYIHKKTEKEKKKLGKIRNQTVLSLVWKMIEEV